MITTLKALADENRMRIYNLLMQTDLCVCELETILQISQSNTSRHLTKLKQANIIKSSKDAQWVHYRISDDFKEHHKGLYEDLERYLSCTEPFASDQKKLDKYFKLGLSCTDIREDSIHVIQLIQED